MEDCLFCDIIAGKVKGDIIKQNEYVVAFRDINPMAPVHALIVPRKHIATLNDLTEDDAELISQAVFMAREVAEDEGIRAEGYRLVWNCNRHAGQTVFHIHLHLLGGRYMGWPPG